MGPWSVREGSVKEGRPAESSPVIRKKCGRNDSKEGKGISKNKGSSPCAVTT